jgi:ATP-binding protein involved in chromosome partitioning
MGELSVSKELIIGALSTVQEPDLKKDLVTLGMIKDVELGVGEVRFTVVLTTPACPLKEKIRKDCEDAIHRLVHPDLKVVIQMTAEVTSLSAADPLIPGVKNVIAIASGKGGVGKSTVTANLAMALKNLGAKVGILDADISGPSIPVMFGAEDLQPLVEEINGKNRIQPIMQYGIKMISMGFLAPSDSPVPWRGPMMTQALRQFFGDTNWGELDYLIVDLPPGTGDVQLTLVQNLPLTGAVIVSTPQKLAVADAGRACAMFQMEAVKVPILGIVENMSFFTPPQKPDEIYCLFGQGGAEKLSKQFETSILGKLPIRTDMMEDAESGKISEIQNVKIFSEIAGKLVQQIAILNSNNKNDQ